MMKEDLSGSIVEDDTTKYLREAYGRSKTDKNMMSYWLPKVKDSGFLIPETIIMQLNLEQFTWLSSDDYSDDETKKFSDSIITYLKGNNFDTNRELFIKTGYFGNKFDFSTCKVTDINNIGKQFLDVFYAGMMVGCETSSEVVVRKYIHSEHNRGTIYNGMPLNTEFRIFYDFDTKNVLGCFNYWDPKTMQTHLRGSDLEHFNSVTDEIETEYLQNEPLVVKLAAERLKEVDLLGKWSVDIMKCGDDYYLIDMALAKQSYYNPDQSDVDIQSRNVCTDLRLIREDI